MIVGKCNSQSNDNPFPGYIYIYIYILTDGKIWWYIYPRYTAVELWIDMTVNYLSIHVSKKIYHLTVDNKTWDPCCNKGCSSWVGLNKSWGIASIQIGNRNAVYEIDPYYKSRSCVIAYFTYITSPDNIVQLALLFYNFPGVQLIHGYLKIDYKNVGLSPSHVLSISYHPYLKRPTLWKRPSPIPVHKSHQIEVPSQNRSIQKVC